MAARFKNLFEFRSCLVLCLLFFIFLDEVSDNYLITSSAKRFKHEDILVYLMQSLQIIFSAIQAGFSDYYLRKKSLIFSITATIISIFIFKFSFSFGASFILLSILVKGMLGNTLPIAWASISDLTREKNFRFALALSICALAIGSWGSLFVIPLLSEFTFFASTLSITVIGLLAAVFIFKDKEDSHKPHSLENKSFYSLIKDECSSIYVLSKRPVVLMALITFLFSEISFYQILFRIEVFDTYYCLISVPLAIGIGYTLGTALLKFIKYEDSLVSFMGLMFSLCALGAILIIKKLGLDIGSLFTFLFVSYSFGYAFFTPALFSMISPKDQPHLQGKIYGVLESVDSLASLITFIIIFNSEKLSCTSVMLFSFVMSILCAIFFLVLQKKQSSSS